MSEPIPSADIARWVQQADDELLYVPDGEEAEPPNLFALTATPALRTPAPAWAIPRARWDIHVPAAGVGTCQALRACFRAHDGMRLPFWCELPAEDGAGRFPVIQQCLWLPDEEMLLLRPLGCVEGPSAPRLVRFDAPTLAFIEQAPGWWTVQFQLVAV